MMKRFFVWFLLIMFFLVSRIYNLERLPLFSDEAYAIVRAWELKQTGELLGMVKYTTQPIFIWLIALFQFLPFDDVISGRLVSGVFGLGTALIISKLAGSWIGRKAAIPAFILMAVLPFSVFYDRTILFESTTLFFMVLALVFPIATGLAVLTKQTGWLILPLVLALGRGSLKGRSLKILISILIVLVVWYFAAGSFGSVSISAHANFKNNLLRSKLWLIDYLTWPVIWLSILGGLAAVVESIKQKKITPILIVAGWALGIFLFINKTAVIFYPRYLYPIVLGVVLLAAKGWNVLSHSESPVGGRRIPSGSFASLRMTIMIIVSFLVLAPSLMLSSRIVLSPESANIPREDGFQFFEDWTSGVGGRQLADKILEIAGSDRINVYLEEENPYFVILKSDQRLKEVRIEAVDWLLDPLTEIPGKVLKDDRTSLFIRNRYPDIPKNWPVELVWDYPKTNQRSVYLYKIIK